MTRALRVAPVWVGLVLLAGCLASDPSDDPSVGTGRCTSGAVEVPFTVDVMTMSGQARLGDPATQRFPVNLTSADVTWECVRGLGATITWTNGPSAGADLYVGLEVPGSWSATGYDQQQLVADGTHTESVLAPIGIAGRDPLAVSDGLVLTVHSDWASLSQGSLPVDVVVTLYT